MAAAMAAPAPGPPAQDTDKVEFEVVSVKPANLALSQGGAAHSTRTSKGRFEARNLPLRDLVRSAFQLNENQIEGGPSWFGTAGWNIDATFPAGGKQSDFPRMLQTMLADRFRLIVHRETRSLPVYLLVMAKGGPKLKESTETVHSSSAGPRMIRYNAASMGELADQLTSYLQRQVIDRTGLTGRYGINLKFAPVNADPSIEAASEESSPSLFQALQEQLGLRLESSRGPVPVLVIDKAERPSEN